MSIHNPEAAVTQQPSAPPPENKEAPARPEVGVSPEGELYVYIPMDKLGRTVSRGVIEDARDAVDTYFKQRSERRQALTQKSLPAQARERLAKIGKLFIP